MKALLIIFLGAVCVAAGPATAQNWIGMLKNTPAERFDEEDLRIFMDTARKALNELPDNQTLSWENPKTRARGDITVLRSFESKGMPCKEAQVRNEVPGRKGGAKFNVCKVEDKWRLVSATQLKTDFKK